MPRQVLEEQLSRRQGQHDEAQSQLKASEAKLEAAAKQVREMRRPSLSLRTQAAAPLLSPPFSLAF